MTPLEVACGVVVGGDPDSPPLPRLIPRLEPRRALEEVMAHALARTPCIVSFSGGRDSSAVLAVATDVARRESLPPPIPATIRFTGVAAAQESAWQELVIGHLGLQDWQRLDVSDDLDLLGPAGRRVLLEFGPNSPEQLHFDLPLLEMSQGGSLLTGEGGDDLFDERRVKYLSYWWSRWRTRPRAVHLRGMVFALTPVPVRRRVHARRIMTSWSGAFDWLQAAARRDALAMIADHVASEPWRWRSFVPWLASRRTLRLPTSYRDALASRFEVHRVDPLLAPTVLASLRDAKSAWGWPDRTAALRHLVGDLLPEEVVSRESKATFGGAVFHRWSRHFVAGWDGSGVDSDLVDAERLRDAWAEPEPDSRTFPLLRQAWWNANTAVPRNGPVSPS